MVWDPNEFLVNREATPIELTIEKPCELCNKIKEDSCEDHQVKIFSFEIKTRKLPWAKKNQIMSASFKWDENGNSSFDGNYYLSECLKYIIAEAPWGATNDTFLSQLDEYLGKALEDIVPKANASSSSTKSIANVKKVP